MGRKSCLFPAYGICGSYDEPFEPPRVVLLDDLKVVLKENEKELNIIVERMWEGFERGRTQGLLERPKGVSCGS